MQTTSHQPQGEENEQSFVDKIAGYKYEAWRTSNQGGRGKRADITQALAKGKEQSEQAASKQNGNKPDRNRAWPFSAR